MKKFYKVFSFILSMVVFISIISGIEVNASPPPKYWTYCDVCQKSGYYYGDKYIVLKDKRWLL